LYYLLAKLVGAKGGRKVKYGNLQSMEEQSVSVPNAAKQIEDALYQRMVKCAEPAVWTERMLQSLCNEGAKNRKWYSLIDKVYSMETLRKAWQRVYRNKGGAGADDETVIMFRSNAEENLRAIHKQLREERYEVSAIKRCLINKDNGKEKRPLGIPTVRDRIVQTALRMVIEPIFESMFSEHSYGFRPKRSQKDALREVSSLIAKGYTHVVDVDLKGYFDSIPHDRLMEYVKEYVADGRVLMLLEQFITASVMEGMNEWAPELGCPQGAVISPLLSNIYLNCLDHTIMAAGLHMVRYADDFVIMCKSQEDTEMALSLVDKYAVEHELTVHPEKTKVVDASTRNESFDFLGYEFRGSLKLVSRKSIRKFRINMRGVTKRCNKHSLEEIIRRANAVLKGWFEYFKHANKYQVARQDGWIRKRLRRILRIRLKKKKGTGGCLNDHLQWPNKFFADNGLFCLKNARMEAVQPLKEGNY